MGIDTNIHDDIRISGLIDEDVYNQFMNRLCKSLAKYQSNYSDTFTLENKYGYSVLTTDGNARGPVEDMIDWLRMVELFILRPNGCYLADQHIHFTEYACVDSSITVSFKNKDGNLVTRVTTFEEDVDEPIVTTTIIPQDMWLGLVSQVTGQRFEDEEHYLNFFKPEIHECYKIHEKYASDFDIKNFINVSSVENMVTDIFSSSFYGE